jgi:choline dehydrogenase-like flavoprotein
MSHYTEAAKLLHVEDACFDPTKFELSRDVSPVQLDAEKFQSSVWRFGKTKADFALEYRKFLAHACSTHMLINACVTNIHLADDGKTVKHLDVRTVSGNTGKIDAKIIILATGGIETPRLLLTSRQQFTNGVGNASDHVGKWFMEHPHVSIEGVEIANELECREWTGVTRSNDGRKFIRCLGLSPEYQSKYCVLNARAHLFRTPAMAEDAPPKIGLFFEQAPNPASRVTLTKNTDALGMPRVLLNWEMSALDRYSHKVFGKYLVEEFLRNGIARQTGPIDLSEEILYSNHQLGTTRMSKNPNDGVVDPNCKVHDIANLYIAGGSVFPTVSWANPTLTVLALTLRLAAHLSEKALHRT